MEMSKRLQHIASYVEQGATLADVGTDHGLLPISLVLSGQVQRAIAIDIAAGPCEVARQNIRRYGLDEAIEVRIGSGLTPLQVGEADTLVLAGMGGATALSILVEGFKVAQAAHRWIVQPMNGADKLRRYFRSIGFPILNEGWLEESGKLYQVMVVTTVQNFTASEGLYVGYPTVEGAWFAYSFGPLALARPGLVYKAVAQYQQQLMNITAQLARGQTPTAAAQRCTLLRRLNWLTEWLQDCTDGSESSLPVKEGNRFLWM
ncbi:SAM-dependent methyltransferase [Alicyclobacillaceae bacterium I2511]|nr:SAM-dependent methyltransferase [Alicyclobacillaceae bacterium I2511]